MILQLKKTKKALEEEVASNNIDIGENVVEREYKRQVFDKFSGRFIEKTVSVFGRKHKLSKLRRKFFKKHADYMRLEPNSYFENLSHQETINKLSSINELIDDEINDLPRLKEKLKTFQRTRYLQVWHDGSAIKNHGHILFCVNIMYDPASFLTSDEYFDKTGKRVNVQRVVEMPELYLIARCRSNDEQLAYIDTRIDDLLELKNSLKLSEIHEKYAGIELFDQLRFFHGDGPAVSFEAGNQKGGHYFCPSCDIHQCQTDDISCSYQQKVFSYHEKQQHVLSGSSGKTNSFSSSLKIRAQPFDELSVNQLESELSSRGIDISGLKKYVQRSSAIIEKVAYSFNQ